MLKLGKADYYRLMLIFSQLSFESFNPYLIIFVIGYNVSATLKFFPLHLMNIIVGNFVLNKMPKAIYSQNNINNL